MPQDSHREREYTAAFKAECSPAPGLPTYVSELMVTIAGNTAETRRWGIEQPEYVGVEMCYDLLVRILFKRAALCVSGILHKEIHLSAAENVASRPAENDYKHALNCRMGGWGNSDVQLKGHGPLSFSVARVLRRRVVDITRNPRFKVTGQTCGVLFHELPNSAARIEAALKNIRLRPTLHNIGRFHSGAQPLVVANTSALSSHEIKAAIQEYVDDEETETESEEGDATA
ncbi:hypothetical protein K438DRAFT_1764182 [Mycena galopus ATCC 62051]|nr:hypothetical protein K438DRAFT_1764182 [Mycena galopus ATCC 62051]